MESLVDVVTTSFQAIMVVATIFSVGYAYNGKQLLPTSKTLVDLSKNVLLPLLVLTTFAASPSLNWKRLLQMWPLAIFALMTHVASLAVSMILKRAKSVPDWTVESLTINNVGSYPLLLVYALRMVSSQGGLAHLHWRIKDTSADVVERASVYILINLLITELFRLVLVMVVARLDPSYRQEEDVVTPEDEEAIEDVPQLRAEPATDEEATERTSLLNRPATTSPSTTTMIKTTLSSPILISAVLGLLIAIIKPLQRTITGVGSPGGGWLYASIGGALTYVGGAYALIDILATGAGIRAGEQLSTPEEKVPPTLGNVLLLCIWRYIAIPAITLPTIVGFQKISSTKIFLQDPAFAFVLALTVITPPCLPPRINPYSSSVLFSTFYSSIITSVPIALAIAYAGRGVSFQVDFDLASALKSAAGGGLAGAAAMVVQVLTLMPMRTIMNYQYRYGGGIKKATMTLWNDGGFKRYYAGLAAALFQGPLSRFGDTAANAGILALLSSFSWPILIKTIAASVASACFRMTLTPIDTVKTTQQTQGGKAGWKLVQERIKEQGVASLWYGALATAAATFVGHYPWFGTYNYLQSILPPPHNLIQNLLRQAFIGFSASVVSDTASNSLRVVKTYRQVHEGDIGYWTVTKRIVASEGLLGLFGRGLPTRLITNGLQGLLFSILWKLFADLIAGKGK